MTRSLLALSLVLSLAGSLRADDVPESLLELLGDDVGLLVHVKDGESTVREALEGRFADRIRDTSVYQQWLQGRDHRNLMQALAAVERVLGDPPAKFAADLLGREFVVALFPVAGGEPEAVLLTRAASEESLQNALRTWDRLQRPTASNVATYGSHEVRTRQHRSETTVLTTIGPILAIAQNASPIEGILDRVGKPTSGSVLASERFVRARAETPKDAAALAYFNPQAWDGTLPEPRDDEGRFVLGVFRRVETVVATLRTGDGLVLDAIVRYDETGSDERWQRYVERIDGTSEFLDCVPRRALYVAVGRVDLAEIGRVIYEEALSEEDRRRADPWRRFVERRVLLGLDPINGLLATIGPEWGAYVVPRDQMVPGASPVEGLVAVGLPTGDPGSDAETARRALDDLLTDGLELWVAVHNSTRAERRAKVRTRDENGTTLRWIEGIGPYRPSFALTPRFLVLTSTPDIVPEFVSPDEDARLVDTPAFEAMRKRYFPEANQLVYLQVPEVRRFVEEHRDFLLRELGRADGDTRTVRLDEILGLVDAVFLAGSIDGSHVRLVIGAVVE